MRFRFFASFVCSALLFLFSVSDGYCQQLPSFTIGIVTDGPILSNPETVSVFKQEIVSIAEGEFTVSFPENLTREADNTVAGVNRELDYLLDNEETDLIIALGTVATAEAVKRRNLSKPIVGSLVLDQELLNAPHQDGGSGVANLTYLDVQTPVGRQIEMFRRLVSFKSLGLLIDERDLQGIPGLAGLARNLANEYTMHVELIPVRGSAADALAAISPGVDAVLVSPLWRLSDDEFSLLSQGLIERRLPSFAMWDRRYVEQGIFAGNMPANLMEHLARRISVTVQEILLGEDAATIPVAFSRGERLSINMATARAIDVYPGLAIMTGADLLHEERRDITRRLNLAQAVRESLQANLDLSIAQRQVAAGEYRVKEVRSVLLPQVGIGTSGRVIDEDRAALGFGQNPEKVWVGSASASQLLYSERGWSDYTVEKFRQTGREYDRDSVRLNIIYETSVAYLNVLRQKTIEQLQKDNMKLTQANLERAQVRLNTGVAGPDELYRWQTQFAIDRQIVLRAQSATLDAMQNLNRILYRPVNEEFIAEETDLSDPLLVAGDKLFFYLMSKPHYLKEFRSFAVTKGLEASPELKFIDSQLDAQKRLMTASKRDFWLPTFSLEGNVDQFFSYDGEGQRDEALTGLDDTDWMLGVYARLPLVEGGRKIATLKKNREELQRLTLTHQATRERITQGILAAINTIRASYPSISLSREAAESARRNLQLVTDSYVQGIKSIIDLLDAQSQALTADLDSANAVYDFLIDQMGLQRSMGVFITFLPDKERQEWEDQLGRFLE
jgi:outer membrane protein TolC